MESEREGGRERERERGEREQAYHGLLAQKDIIKYQDRAEEGAKEMKREGCRKQEKGKEEERQQEWRQRNKTKQIGRELKRRKGLTKRGGKDCMMVVKRGRAGRNSG